MQNRCRTPDDEDDNHHRGYAHDLQGFLAGLVNSLSVLPPEIHRHHHGKNGGAEVLLNLEMQMGVLQQPIQQAHEIESGRNSADRPGEDVIEHQRRN